MSEPTDEAYEAATAAYDNGGSWVDPIAAVRAVVDAVWALAVAAGRQEAAEANRAEARERRNLAKDALERQEHGDDQAERHKVRFLAQAVALEQMAARIAEGSEVTA